MLFVLIHFVTRKRSSPLKPMQDHCVPLEAVNLFELWLPLSCAACREQAVLCAGVNKHGCNKRFVLPVRVISTSSDPRCVSTLLLSPTSNICFGCTSGGRWLSSVHLQKVKKTTTKNPKTTATNTLFWLQLYECM